MKKYNLHTSPGKEVGEGARSRVVKILASPNSILSAPEFTMGIVKMEPGFGHEIHWHDENREIMIVLSGKALMHQKEGDEGILLEKGDFVGFGYGEPHGFENIGDETFCLLWIYYPAGQAETKYLITDMSLWENQA